MVTNKSKSLQSDKLYALKKKNHADPKLKFLKRTGVKENETVKSRVKTVFSSMRWSKKHTNSWKFSKNRSENNKVRSYVADVPTERQESAAFGSIPKQYLII